MTANQSDPAQAAQPSVVEAAARIVYECRPDVQPWNGDPFGFAEAKTQGRFAASKAVQTAEALNAAGALSTNPPCAMTHQEPYDFAACSTHDTTFALGDTCKFDGKDPFGVLYDEADEQRGLKVRAEMDLEELLQVVASVLVLTDLSPDLHEVLSLYNGGDLPSESQAKNIIDFRLEEARAQARAATTNDERQER